MWQADGLQANIVTFNTLIDAMGKAGRWQDAIGVLDIIDQQVSGPTSKHTLHCCDHETLSSRHSLAAGPLQPWDCAGLHLRESKVSTDQRTVMI